MATCRWVLVDGCMQVSVGRWLHAGGCWYMAACRWVLVDGCMQVGVGRWLHAGGCW